MREIDYQIENFLSHCQIKGLSPKTTKSYSQALFLFASYLEKELNITDATKVKPLMITSYITYLQQRGKYTVIGRPRDYTQPNYPERRTDYNKRIGTATINGYIRYIKVFFGFLFEFDEIQKNPMEKIRQIKYPHQPLEFITDEQFNTLIRSLDLSHYHEYRDKIIIHLLLDTGMRIGECLLIELDDINLINNSIFLPAEHTKTKQSRTVFFSLQMRKMLKIWLKHKSKFNSSNYLFPNISGGKLEINSFESNLRWYVDKANLSITVSPKTFRNNFAKRFLLSGGDIFTLSKILGHSSVTTTEKAYLDLTVDDLRNKYQMYSPLANMK